jgi:hypothetical protein
MKIRIEEHTRGDGSKIYGAQYREWVGVFFGCWGWKHIYASGIFWHDTMEKARAGALKWKDQKKQDAELKAKESKIRKTTYHYL